MARARAPQTFERLSEEMIDLTDDKIARPAAEEFVDIQKLERPPATAGISNLFTGLPFIVVGLTLSIIAVVWLLVISGQRAEREATYIEQSSQLLMLSQRLAKDEQHRC